MRALLTRCREDADQLAKLLQKRKVASLIAPMLEIVTKEGVELDFTGVQALLFTSANGVRAFAKNSGRRDLKVFAIGDATAKAAKEAGFSEVESAGGNVGTLAEYVKIKADSRKGAFLHPAAGEVAGDLAGSLKDAGFEVRRVVLYEAEPLKELPSEVAQVLKEGGFDFALFFSPRTAETFAKLVEAAGLVGNCGKITALCLSQAVADKLSGLDFAKVVVAEKPDQDSLLAALDPLAPKKGWSFKTWLYILLLVLLLGSGAGIYFTQDIWKPQLLAKITDLLGGKPVAKTDDITPALAARIGKLETEVAALKGQSQPKPVDIGPLELRLRHLEEALNSPRSPVAAAPAVNGEAMAQNLSDLAARITFIEANAARGADLNILHERMLRLEQNQKDFNAQRENSALLLFAFSNLREAALKGMPFTSELKILLSAAAGQTLTGEALLGLADKGMPSLSVLRQGLGDIRLSKSPGKEKDLWQGALENLQSLIRIKKTEGGQGLLAAVEQAKLKLDARDVQGAINVIAAEKGVDNANWLNAAQMRLEGEKALTALGNQILSLAAKKEK